MLSIVDTARLSSHGDIMIAGLREYSRAADLDQTVVALINVTPAQIDAEWALVTTLSRTQG